MNVEEVRAYCLLKPGVEECLPFDDETLVFKIGGKIFALLSLDGKPAINLKCDPEKAIDLREHYEYVTPGYHMNKKHWNTIDLTLAGDNKQITEWIDHSYELVIRSLPGKLKEKIIK